MSLDSDRSPDGEPTKPAGQTHVPAQAPATMGPAQPIGPSFIPAPVPADAEPAAGQHAADETVADEPAADEAVADEHEPAHKPSAYEHTSYEATAAEPAADERMAGEPAAREPAAFEPAADEPAATEATPGEHTAAEPAEDESAADEAAADESAAFEPATGELAATEATADEPTASEVTAYRSSVAPAWEADGTRTAEGSASRTAGVEPMGDLDGPLISDADELLASWQRIQAAFVDDPREAVSDAAGLVEHAAQALTGALRQRQQQLRAMWDRDGMPDGVEYADSGGTAPRAASPDRDTRAAADGPDTEQMRLLIQRYRALFNHLCRP